MKAIAIANPRASVRVQDLPGDGVPLFFVRGLGCACLGLIRPALTVQRTVRAVESTGR